MSSLRRVSSRQRLVSWDAFDATVYYDSTEEDDGEEAMSRKARESSSSSSLNTRSQMISPSNTPTTTTISVGKLLRSEDTDDVVPYDHHDMNNHDVDDSDIDSLDFKRKRRVHDTLTMTTTINTTTTTPTTIPLDSHLGTTTTTIPTTSTKMTATVSNPLSPYMIYAHDPEYVHHIPTPLFSTDSESRWCHGRPRYDSLAATTPFLLRLPIEVQCMIYQYLNLIELRCVTQTCTTLRHSLLRSSKVPLHHCDDIEQVLEETNDIVESALWTPLCIHQYWPFLQTSPDQEPVLPNPPLVVSTKHDDDHLIPPNQRITNNYPLLLSLAVSNIPTHIDTTLFPYSRQLRHIRNTHHSNGNLQRTRYQPQMISMNCTITTNVYTKRISNIDHETSTVEYQNGQQRSHQVIQFIGRVGFGDQCIRSNAPLPRPQRIQTTATGSKWNLSCRPLGLSRTTSTTGSSIFQRVFRNTGTIPSRFGSSTTMVHHASTGTTAHSATTATGGTTNIASTSTITSSLLFCPLRRSARIVAKRGSITTSSNSSSYHNVTRTMMIPYRPFCVPFMTLQYEVNIAPRYVAYYEVTILPLPSVSPGMCDDHHPTTTTTAVTIHHHTRTTKDHETTITKSIQYPIPHNGDYSDTSTHRQGHTTVIIPPISINTTITNSNNGVRSTISDCVAVGIGTESFPLQHRMPGWDHNSYGYHGDDGGIFHGNGSMIQQYNRTFGVNDTIGCGIDYIQNSIFFTLNGVFLGYAFPLLSQHRDVDLYPIIGMDTSYPICCNFGTDAPFVFDLQSMIEQQHGFIQEQLTV